jgi:hypothetical protein
MDELGCTLSEECFKSLADAKPAHLQELYDLLCRRGCPSDYQDIFPYVVCHAEFLEVMVRERKLTVTDDVMTSMLMYSDLHMTSVLSELKPRYKFDAHAARSKLSLELDRTEARKMCAILKKHNFHFSEIQFVKLAGVLLAKSIKTGNNLDYILEEVIASSLCPERNIKFWDKALDTNAFIDESSGYDSFDLSTLPNIAKKLIQLGFPMTKELNAKIAAIKTEEGEPFYFHSDSSESSEDLYDYDDDEDA